MGEPDKNSFNWGESSCDPASYVQHEQQPQQQQQQHPSDRPKKHDMALQLGSLKDAGFVADQTPTPNSFIKYAESVGLFQDLQNVNPFEETFKRASEARSNKQLNVKTPLPDGHDDTLHTPQIFPHIPEANHLYLAGKLDANLTLNRSGSDDNVDQLSVIHHDTLSSVIAQEKDILFVEKEKLAPDKSIPRNNCKKLRLTRQHSIDICDSETGGTFSHPSNVSETCEDRTETNDKTFNIPSIQINDSEFVAPPSDRSSSESKDLGEVEILVKLPSGEKMFFKGSQANASESGGSNSIVSLKKTSSSQIDAKESVGNRTGVKRKLKDFVHNNIKRNISTVLKHNLNSNNSNKLPIRPLYSNVAVNLAPTITPCVIRAPNTISVISGGCNIISLDSLNIINSKSVELNGDGRTFNSEASPKPIAIEKIQSLSSRLVLTSDNSNASTESIGTVITSVETYNNASGVIVENPAKSRAIVSKAKSTVSKGKDKSMTDEEKKRADVNDRNKVAQLRYRIKKKKMLETSLKINMRLEAENKLLKTKLDFALDEIKRLNERLQCSQNSSGVIVTDMTKKNK